MNEWIELNWDKLPTGERTTLVVVASLITRCWNWMRRAACQSETSRYSLITQTLHCSRALLSDRLCCIALERGIRSLDSFWMHFIIIIVSHCVYAVYAVILPRAVSSEHPYSATFWKVKIVESVVLLLLPIYLFPSFGSLIQNLLPGPVFEESQKSDVFFSDDGFVVAVALVQIVVCIMYMDVWRVLYCCYLPHSFQFQLQIHVICFTALHTK